VDARHKDGHDKQNIALPVKRLENKRAENVRSIKASRLLAPSVCAGPLRRQLGGDVRPLRLDEFAHLVADHLDAVEFDDRRASVAGPGTDGI
jgi:hypothetical protein